MPGDWTHRTQLPKCGSRGISSTSRHWCDHRSWSRQVYRRDRPKLLYLWKARPHERQVLPQPEQTRWCSSKVCSCSCCWHQRRSENQELLQLLFDRTYRERLPGTPSGKGETCKDLQKLWRLLTSGQRVSRAETAKGMPFLRCVEAKTIAFNTPLLILGLVSTGQSDHLVAACPSAQPIAPAA